MKSKYLLLLFALCFWVAPALVDSQRKLFAHEELKRNVEADNIFVCSDFDRLDAARIEKFLDDVFPEAAHPIVYDGYREVPEASTLNVLLLAANKNPSQESLDCVRDFAAFSDDLGKIVLDYARKLGQGPSEAEIRLSPIARFYGPLLSTWRYVRAVVKHNSRRRLLLIWVVLATLLSFRQSAQKASED